MEGLTPESFKKNEMDARARARKQVLNGVATVTWEHPQVSSTAIKRLFEKHELRHLEDVYFSFSETDLKKDRDRGLNTLIWR